MDGLLKGLKAMKTAEAGGAGGQDAADLAKLKNLSVFKKMLDDEPAEPPSLLKSKLTIKGHKGPIYALAFTPDGKLLFTGGKDKVIRVWRVEDGKKELEMEGHQEAVTFLTVSGNGESLFSASRDGTVRVWWVRDGTCVRSTHLHTLQDAPEEGTVPYLLNESNIYGPSFLSGAKTQYAVVISKDGARACIGMGNGSVGVWRASAGTLTRTLVGHKGPVGALALSSDDRTLISGSGDYTIMIWDLKDKKAGRNLPYGANPHAATATLEGHMGPITALQLSADDLWLFSASSDCTVKTWRCHRKLENEDGVDNLFAIHDATCVLTTRAHAGKPVRCGVFAPSDGTGLGALFTGGEDSAIKMWRGSDMNPLGTERVHRDWVTALAVSKSGEFLASGGHDKLVVVWTVASIQKSVSKWRTGVKLIG